MFVRCERTRQGIRVETCPISGTIERGSNPLEDAQQVRALLTNKKEESELTMCTDVDRYVWRVQSECVFLSEVFLFVVVCVCFFCVFCTRSMCTCILSVCLSVCVFVLVVCMCVFLCILYAFGVRLSFCLCFCMCSCVSFLCILYAFSVRLSCLYVSVFCICSCLCLFVYFVRVQCTCVLSVYLCVFICVRVCVFFVYFVRFQCTCTCLLSVCLCVCVCVRVCVFFVYFVYFVRRNPPRGVISRSSPLQKCVPRPQAFGYNKSLDVFQWLIIKSAEVWLCFTALPRLGSGWGCVDVAAFFWRGATGGRNDKSRICEPSSVRVLGRRQIEMYSRLIHTVDHVEG